MDEQLPKLETLLPQHFYGFHVEPQPGQSPKNLKFMVLKVLKSPKTDHGLAAVKVLEIIKASLLSDEYLC